MIYFIYVIKTKPCLQTSFGFKIRIMKWNVKTETYKKHSLNISLIWKGKILTEVLFRREIHNNSFTIEKFYHCLKKKVEF